jgi:hypothetical protein
MKVNDSDVMAEVRDAVDRYEIALMQNDLEALDDFFWESPFTIRFGVAENLYGFDAIKAFRLGRTGGSPPRDRLRTEIVALGNDVAIAHVEFVRRDSSRHGRQTQTWIRTAKGWKVVSAHVSLLQQGTDQRLRHG